MSGCSQNAGWAAFPDNLSYVAEHATYGCALNRVLRNYCGAMMLCWKPTKNAGSRSDKLRVNRIRDTLLPARGSLGTPLLTPVKGRTRQANPFPAEGWTEFAPPPDTRPLGGLGAGSDLSALAKPADCTRRECAGGCPAALLPSSRCESACKPLFQHQGVPPHRARAATFSPISALLDRHSLRFSTPCWRSTRT